MTLTFGLGLALGTGLADAVPRGGFPSGARLYGLAPVVRHPAKAATVKAPPKLAEPLDYLDAIVVTPSRLLEYPFLNPPRCPVQNAASIACAAPNSASDDVLAGQSSVVR
jgi:hypothetical protein